MELLTADRFEIDAVLELNVVLFSVRIVAVGDTLRTEMFAVLKLPTPADICETLSVVVALITALAGSSKYPHIHV